MIKTGLLVALTAITLGACSTYAPEVKNTKPLVYKPAKGVKPVVARRAVPPAMSEAQAAKLREAQAKLPYVYQGPAGTGVSADQKGSAQANRPAMVKRPIEIKRPIKAPLVAKPASVKAAVAKPVMKKPAKPISAGTTASSAEQSVQITAMPVRPAVAMPVVPTPPKASTISADDALAVARKRLFERRLAAARIRAARTAAIDNQ